MASEERTFVAIKPDGVKRGLIGKVIQNAELPVYIMLSGGTNSKTAELAKMCGINYWGIAIGSWARKIVKPYVLQNDFWENRDVQDKAIKVAKKLIESCK